MRILFPVIATLALCGCTALMLGNGSAGGGAAGSGRPASQVNSDGATTAEIRSLFRADPMISTFNISVETKASRVTLRGTVSSYSARQRAAELAATVAGVAAVDNRIAVAGR